MALIRKIQYLGELDTGNSSIVPLDADKVFTGDSVEVLSFGIAYISISTNVISAVNGLSIQQSSDGTNFDHVDTFTVPAGGGKYSVSLFAQFLRVVYTNGSSNQAHLRLETILKPAGELLESSPIGIEGSPVSVGTTAVELTFSGATKVISIKSASTNTGIIWFGPSTITNTGANAFGELTGDSAVEIELNDSITAIYVISDTVSQKIYKAALI